MLLDKYQDQIKLCPIKVEWEAGNVDFLSNHTHTQRKGTWPVKERWHIKHIRIIITSGNKNNRLNFLCPLEGITVIVNERRAGMLKKLEGKIRSVLKWKVLEKLRGDRINIEKKSEIWKVVMRRNHPEGSGKIQSNERNYLGAHRHENPTQMNCVLEDEKLEWAEVNKVSTSYKCTVFQNKTKQLQRNACRFLLFVENLKTYKHFYMYNVKI